jgi:hypothetical protein
MKVVLLKTVSMYIMYSHNYVGKDIFNKHFWQLHILINKKAQSTYIGNDHIQGRNYFSHSMILACIAINIRVKTLRVNFRDRSTEFALVKWTS